MAASRGFGDGLGSGAGRIPAPLASDPEEFGRYISAEVVKWREIITKGGITLE